LGQVWSLARELFAALVKELEVCTTLKIGARSARVNVSPKNERCWKSTFHEAQGKANDAQRPESRLRHGREGDQIVLEGEADQVPDQEPGDIVFSLEQSEHETFRRQGTDLLAELEVTLAEALCGFSRVVIKHLDGRGIYMQHSEPTVHVLEPGQVIKIPHEGMPHKKSDLKGDLYLVVKVIFPQRAWLAENQAIGKLRELLPGPGNAIQADDVDDVAYDVTASCKSYSRFQFFHNCGLTVYRGICPINMYSWALFHESTFRLGEQMLTEIFLVDDFGQGEEGGGTWVDESEEDGQPQCAQQ